MSEANKAEILRRMDKIRKHLAKIEELMSGEDEKAEAEEKPWYPPEDPEFGPWIPFTGTVCPVDRNVVVQWLLVDEMEQQKFLATSAPAKQAPWVYGNIVAYRVKK